MFSITQVADNFQINPITFKKFIQKTEELYNRHSNPYHNFKHAASVLNSFYMLLRTTDISQYFTKTGIGAMVFASLVHDIEHTGRNNLFEINSISKLAVRYNDNSVLENHHAARGFKILAEKELNIFKNMHKNDYLFFRKYVIRAILSTDIKKHFSELTVFKKRLDSGDFEPFEEETLKDFLLMIGVILHCCDLYIYTLDKNFCVKWTHVIKEEFSAQSEFEIEHGLPVTPFYLNLDKIDVQAKSEVSFIRGIVSPIWLEVDRFLKGNLENRLENIEEALLSWKKIQGEEEDDDFMLKLKDRKLAFEDID